MRNLGLYIHIPFCVKKCYYCDFISYTNCQNNICKYVQALCAEIEKEKEYAKGKIVDTIYFGGGTPSYIDAKYIAQIMEVIKQNYQVDSKAEITIECNPNSVTREKIATYLKVGINRISIGLQAKQKPILKAIGRVHSLQDYKEAVSIIKEVGVTNINTDVMFGLPKQSYRSILGTLKLAMKNSTHISAYSLILEEGTPLYQSVQEGHIKLPKEDKVVRWYKRATKYLRRHGYERYEVSNFARHGYESQHNLHCWQYDDYLGFGVASSSKIGDSRWTRTKDLREYCTLVNSGQSTVIEEEKLSKTEQLEEYIMLGLRTKDGVQLDNLLERFGYDLQKEKSETIKQLMNLRLIEFKDNAIRLLDDGYYVMNSIIVELLPD